MTATDLVLAVAAATSAAGAVVLWRLPSRWLLALRLGPPAGAAVAPGRLQPLDALRAASRRWSGRLPVVVAVVGAPWLVTSPVSALLLATSAGVAVSAVRHVGRARDARAASELAGRVAGTLELLAAELRTGVLPAVALRGACDDLPELRQVSEVAARGGDVAAAIEVLARRPGAGALAHLAAAWRVAERAGAPVASVLEHVVEAVRADHDLAREVRAECASARATARLLAALPVLGLGLGSGMGGDPVHVLTGTLPGVLCLASGCALAAAGLAWVERIVRRAEGDDGVGASAGSRS